MISRVVLGIIAVVGVGLVCAPVEAAARSGGFGARGGGFSAGRAIVAPRAFHRFHARPLRPHVRPAPRHFGPFLPAPRHFGHVRPGPRHFGHHRFAGHRHPFRPRLNRRDNGYDLGYGVPVAGVYVYYGSPTYPEDDVESWRRRSYVVPTYDASAIYAANPAGAGPATPSRHICRSDAQKVPREQGGEAEITVTRCYSVDEP